jgi:predicted NBD/HSP70 family sugar kinase
MKTLWGVDLGGTKIEGVVMNSENNEILSRKRIPTEATKGYEHIISQVVRLIDSIKESILTTRYKIRDLQFSEDDTVDDEDLEPWEYTADTE